MGLGRTGCSYSVTNRPCSCSVAQASVPAPTLTEAHAPISLFVKALYCLMTKWLQGRPGQGSKQKSRPSTPFGVCAAVGSGALSDRGIDDRQDRQTGRAACCCSLDLCQRSHPQVMHVLWQVCTGAVAGKQLQCGQPAQAVGERQTDKPCTPLLPAAHHDAPALPPAPAAAHC